MVMSTSQPVTGCSFSCPVLVVLAMLTDSQLQTSVMLVMLASATMQAFIFGPSCAAWQACCESMKSVKSFTDVSLTQLHLDPDDSISMVILAQKGLQSHGGLQSQTPDKVDKDATT